MSRISSRSEARWVVWALLCGGCASGGGPTFPTTEAFPARPRTPPSFAVDDGDTGFAEVAGPESSGVARLEIPLDPEDAGDVVRRFFSAVLLESSKDLFPLFSGDASVISDGNRQPAQALWRARLAQLDYRSLGGRVVAGPGTLRTYTFGTQARALSAGVPVPASPAEVVVVARLSLSWAGKTRLFGDELAFRLRPKVGGSRFEIAEIAEDFRLP